MRKTKILCTLGPATESPEAIASLIKFGADVIRINMSHAAHDWVRMVYQHVRDAAEGAGREVSVLMDLTGPSIRTGDLDVPWQLQPGDLVEFRTTPESQPTIRYSVTVNYPGLARDLKTGDLINVDGGIDMQTIRPAAANDFGARNSDLNTSGLWVNWNFGCCAVIFPSNSW